MLLRILLITSIAIVTNDRRRRFQKKSVAVSLSKHLGISVTGLLIPTALSFVTTPSAADINKQSRGVSILLLFLYGLYLYSEWRTYALLGIQIAETEKLVKEAREAREAKERAEKGIVLAKGIAVLGVLAAAVGRPNLGDEIAPPEPLPPPPPPVRQDILIRLDALDEDTSIQKPQLHFWISIIMPAIVGFLLALHVVFMVDSTKGITEESGLSQEFIGLILFPILGVDSTLLHLDNRYDSDEATRTTLGLGLQTILFVMPLLVLVSWWAGIEDMNLLFSPFEVTVLFPAVMVVQASIEEKDNGW